MQFPLKQFEQYIDETILERGHSYFRRGRVNQPEEIAPGQYEAIVEGTEDYTVRLNLQNDTVTEFTCDCHYDYGPVCKHVAAVMFHLQQDELELKANKRSGKKGSQKPRKRTVAQQVDDILEKLSHDELAQFNKDLASRDKSFRQLLLSTFAHLNENESITLYKQQIQGILRTASDRHGFIERNMVRIVGIAVNSIVETGQKHFNAGNFNSAMLIAFAVLEEMTEALQYADDSNGDIGSAIDGAYNLLAALSTEDLPEDLRKQLFSLLIQAYESNNFSGWDWHLGMLSIASMIANGDNEVNKVISLLEQVKRERYDYEYERAQRIKLELIRRVKGDDVADKFMEQHLANPSFRSDAILKAISKKDYGKAITLAQEGIKQDAKDKPGLVMDWYEWLLKIAMKQKDREKTIEYARLLYVDSIKEKQQFYHILKSHVEKDNWPAFVEGLVKDMSTGRSWLRLGEVAQIYINEEAWEKLMSMLKQEFDRGRVSLESINHYEGHLAKLFPEDLTVLYEKGIINLLEHNVGRSHYKNACRFIRRMKKLGANEQAAKLIGQLKATYPQRRALMEELGRV